MFFPPKWRWTRPLEQALHWLSFEGQRSVWRETIMRASVHTGMAESCRVSLPEAVAYPLELGDGMAGEYCVVLVVWV
jgi:hypothetical protein